MKQTPQKETSTGTPDVGTDPNQWLNTVLSGATQIGTVLADNLTRSQQQVIDRQPSAAPVPWYKQMPVMIGAAVGGVVLLLLLMRRK